MSRYACVADQKAAGFPVTAACKSAEVSTSGFYDWCQREAAPPTDREIAEADLVALIREIFDATEGNYGVPRMHRELRDRSIVVNVKRVRRLMRLHGMAGRCIRRRVRTTVAGPDGYTIPDLVGRAFTPGAPDVAWCQDITYIPTGEGWLYLASVIDIGSRRMLGYTGGRSHAHRARDRRARHGPRRPRRSRRGCDCARGPRLAVHIERLPRSLPTPPTPPLRRTSCDMLR